VTLGGKKSHLKLTEDRNQKGRYVASYTPKSEGYTTVHVYGKVGKTEIEATLHPEKVVSK
jgi:hypothetical protein